jgi:hypothetical protein
MNTLGYLSIERNRGPWSRAVSDGYLSAIAIGILAGIVVAFARTPIHLPGHKAILWMAPILATRLVTRSRAGASVGAFSTAITTLSLGGRIAGGIAMMPLVVLAGVVLDGAIRVGERHHFARWQLLLLLASAGAVGNLICFAKRVFDPMGAFFSVGNFNDMLIAASSHAFFGFLAGLLGAAAGNVLLKFRPPLGSAMENLI